MSIYRDFAYIYMKGDYAAFSRGMAALLPSVLERFEAEPHTILDLACGEGSFAAAMARRGYAVTALDSSPDMLKLARDRTRQENQKIEFVEKDMRSLEFESEFDLVTCWFDSLNYLLDTENLERCFRGVHRALKENGLFIFDMNTVYGLGVVWQRQPCYVEQDNEEILEVHRQTYDFERNIATMRVTGFMKRGDTWTRVDEEHREKGYSLAEIDRSLKNANFDVVATCDNLENMTEPMRESSRVWFIAKKKPA